MIDFVVHVQVDRPVILDRSRVITLGAREKFDYPPIVTMERDRVTAEYWEVNQLRLWKKCSSGGGDCEQRPTAGVVWP